MCTAKVPAFSIPALTIRSDSRTGLTTMEPELVNIASRSGAVRSLRIDMGPYPAPTTVTVELLPSEVLLLLKNPVLRLTMDNQEVASISLKDGTVLQFG